MEIAPVLRALTHRKIGVVLIVLQVALSVAILANSLSIVEQRQGLMRRPSGLDEANTFSMTNQFTGSLSDLPARIATDLSVLRSIPGVVDATAVQSFPLRGYGASTTVTLRPDDRTSNFNSAEYALTPNGFHTWNMKLIAGRSFRADEIKEFWIGISRDTPPTAIITRALAGRLFPRGGALGQNVYLGSTVPTQIIGIVERAQTPWAAALTDPGPFGAEEALLVPFQWVSPILAYVVRTEPGRNEALLAPAQQRLFAVSRARVISDAQTFSQTRAEQYRSDRALGLVLTVVCGLLLSVTAFGVVALTSYWVSQRRRQIGLRRAVGARRLDIVQYFQVENLLISGFGAALGVAVGFAGNAWLANAFEMARMSIGYIVAAAAMLLVLSQIAVLWPALRAAALPPVAAIRGR
jgi:putative ABC transport system permease protein